MTNQLDRFNKRTVRMGQKVVAIVFIAYCAVLVTALLLSDTLRNQSAAMQGHVVPLLPIVLTFQYRIEYAMIHGLLNVLLFVPMGALIPQFRLFGGSFWKALILFVVAGLAAECLRMLPFAGRIFDINDVIYNVFGGIVGWLGNRMVCFLLERKKRGKLIGCAVALGVCLTLMIVPFCTPNKYQVPMVDSLYFLPLTLLSDGMAIHEDAANAEIEDWGVETTGFEQLEPTITPQDALERATYGVAINLYTEGIAHPERIEITEATLVFVPSAAKRVLIPAWKCTGKAIGEGIERKAMMVLPAVWF